MATKTNQEAKNGKQQTQVWPIMKNIAWISIQMMDTLYNALYTYDIWSP